MRTRTEELTDFLYGGPYPKTYPTGLERILMRKLQMIKAAHELRDLKIPPGNRLEPPKGNLKGYWSIRINQQWRLAFQWDDNNKEAIDVHFDDYHN
ncbi:toxin [Bifidobacterium callitrichos]|uniref:Toxin n=1 Tax=Bifidobacterium callitrichos TaxID=762209 RepID=A0A5M9ZDC5_9BIFI|nr:type II toxin-antitoxin system RelE/ParE family toxin [Bifidobacterium callitrichos]KAA8817121.1 toxin [Bifidobacterium callitrichos]